jgi:hypothetical protein
LSNSKSTTTPHQLWCGETPNISHLRIFGLVAFVHIPKVNRQKLDPKSVKCLFVGNATIQTAYRCWSPTERKIKIRRNVIFDKQINCNPFSPSEPTNLFFFEKYILQPSADTSQIEREIKKSDPDAQFEPSIQAELPTPDVQFESTDTPTSVTDVSTSTDNQPKTYLQPMDPTASYPPALVQSAPKIPVRISPYPLRIRIPNGVHGSSCIPP